MNHLLSIAMLAVAAMVPAMASDTPARSSLVVGGGCFWCVEASFEALPGVVEAVSGYAGGTLDNPSYEDICGGDTGHAEVVRVVFDPAVVSLDKLLDLFYRVHDPTTLNAQGPDHGTQYRSVILVADPAQRQAALASIARNQKRFSDPIVTQVVDLPTSGPGRFHRAEEYHQDFFKKNPSQAYCRAMIPAKLDKVRKFLDGH